MPPFPALPAELTIYAAADTHQAWMAWCSAEPPADGPLHVDARAVETIDGAGLQLLLALARTLLGHGRALVLDAPSAVLRSACLDLGAGQLLAGADR